jgi:hypothetical protein
VAQGLNASSSLGKGESLVHLSLYDSVNCEKTHEYVCFGEQTLLEAVCAFYCLIARLEGKEQTHHLNSYCLIEDCFYYHGPQARKKVEDIIAFSQQAHEGSHPEPPLRLLEMGKSRLKHLRVVFGRPYVYRHLEGCDHVLIFKDLHLLTEGQSRDPVGKEKYPLVVFEGRMRRRKCEGCRCRFAEWVSLSDPLKGGKHLYLCGDCHSSLHREAREAQVFIRYLHD